LKRRIVPMSNLSEVAARLGIPVEMLEEVMGIKTGKRGAAQFGSQVPPAFLDMIMGSFGGMPSARDGQIQMIIGVQPKPGEVCPICGEVHIPLPSKEACPTCGGPLKDGVCPVCSRETCLMCGVPHAGAESLFDSGAIMQLVKSPPFGLKSATLNQQAGVNQGGNPYSVQTVKLVF
jgi:hypothetical protein